MKKIIFAIFAHPDDEAFGPSGALLKEVKDGNDLHLITFTNGDAGMNPDNARDLGAVRTQEWDKAGQLFGAKTMHLLGYEDGRLSETPLNELRERCMRAIRTHRPDVLFTWDAWAPYEEHQDHRSIGLAATEAASFSHFPLYHPEHREGGLDPHYVGERYYFAKNPRDVNKVVDISGTISRMRRLACRLNCPVVSRASMMSTS